LEERKMETVKTEKNYEPSEVKATPGSIARRTILGIAKAWEKKGELFQAAPVYEYLIEKAPGSIEAKEAKEALLKLAQFYLKLDANYCALSLYKFLMEAEKTPLFQYLTEVEKMEAEKARCKHED
jgi:hypothetical protein